jgi:hypothetical protein
MLFLLPGMTIALAGALDGIPMSWSWLGYGSGWAIVGMFVIAMARGRIVGRGVVDDVRQDRDARVAEANARVVEADARVARAEERAEQWRQAQLATHDTTRIAVAQVHELLEMARLGASAAQVAKALPELTASAGEPGAGS